MRSTWWCLPLALAGCTSNGGGGGDTCVPNSVPAFRVALSADGAALPPDVAVEVVFGGGDETWSLADAAAPHKSVFCHLPSDAGAADAGADDANDGADADDAGDADDASERGADGGLAGGLTGGLVCELWTSGAARIVVRASGFATLDRGLAAQSDACGLVTSEIALALDRAD